MSHFRSSPDTHHTDRKELRTIIALPAVAAFALTVLLTVKDVIQSFSITSNLPSYYPKSLEYFHF